MHGIKREDQADAADYTGSDYAWMRKFGVKTEHAHNQEYEENIRLNDARQEFFARRELERGLHWIVQCQRDFAAVKARDGTAVKLTQEIVDGIDEEIDHFSVQGFFVGEGFGFGDGGFGQGGIAAALFRKAAKKGHGVLIYFFAKDFVELRGDAADDHNGRRRAGVGTRSHGGDIGGEQNIKSCGGAARA